MNEKLVDIHSHLTVESGIVRIHSKSVNDFSISTELMSDFLFSVGFHPRMLNDWNEQTFSDLEKLSTHKHMVAVGECGLDKFSSFPLSVQMTIFEQQILLSEQYKKPLIIHCVGYFNELFAVKKKMQPFQPWIIHGFRGKPELALQALKSGCSLSFGKYFNPESVKVTPIDRIFVESDEQAIDIGQLYLQLALIKNCTVSDLDAGLKLFTDITKNHELY